MVFESLRLVFDGTTRSTAGKMMNNTQRTTDQKTALFRRFFTGLEHVYGSYDPRSGSVHQVKAPVTRQVILSHLCGRKPYGVYLLVRDRTRAVVADFDEDDLNLPIEFVKAARHYGIPAYIERSKSKGHHVWVFSEECGVPAWKARAVVRHLLAEIGRPLVEVFPKHDSLDTSVTYGNFINAPLFGTLVAQGRTVFLDPRDFSRPAASQWDLLESIETVPEAKFDEVIEINDLQQIATSPSRTPDATGGIPDRTFGLPPCAQRMLTEGVTDNQRVSCFRLAVHLRQTGLPFDLAVATLVSWAQKNKPQPDKRIITEEEVSSQARSAYDKPYRGCGCDEPAISRYCSPDCRLRQSGRRTPQEGSSQGVGAANTNARPETPQ